MSSKYNCIHLFPPTNILLGKEDTIWERWFNSCLLRLKLSWSAAGVCLVKISREACGSVSQSYYSIIGMCNICLETDYKFHMSSSFTSAIANDIGESVSPPCVIEWDIFMLKEMHIHIRAPPTNLNTIMKLHVSCDEWFPKINCGLQNIKVVHN